MAAGCRDTKSRTRLAESSMYRNAGKMEYCLMAQNKLEDVRFLDWDVMPCILHLISLVNVHVFVGMLVLEDYKLTTRHIRDPRWTHASRRSMVQHPDGRDTPYDRSGYERHGIHTNVQVQTRQWPVRFWDAIVQIPATCSAICLAVPIFTVHSTSNMNYIHILLHFYSTSSRQ